MIDHQLWTHRLGFLLAGIICLAPFSAPAAIITGPTGGGQPHNNMQPFLAVNYLIRTSGSFDAVGQVTMFGGNFAPAGFAFANGQLLNINSNQALFSKIGTIYGGDGETTFALPDLRGRVAIGDGQGAGLTNRNLGERGGTETVALTTSQIPSHSHTTPTGDTGLTGGGQPHTNMQPFTTLNYLVALNGLFPSESGGSNESTPYLGEIKLFGGNFAPGGFALAHGQLLSIASNTALFSLYGTTYGGDGETTFALPDLRGRTALHFGSGAGLSHRSLGQRGGAEDDVLFVNNLPSHTHTHTDTHINNVPEPHSLQIFLSLILCFGAAGLRRKRYRATGSNGSAASVD